MNVKKPSLTISLILPVFLSISLFISGCATQLAPKYDIALFQGMSNANTKVMELFAWLAPGSKASSFTRREPIYNATIGQIDALIIQAKARPVPSSTLVKKIDDYLRKRGMSVLIGTESPSASALETLSKMLVKMKGLDRTSGLKPKVVALFKNSAIISMDQALTYESFLNR